MDVINLFGLGRKRNTLSTDVSPVSPEVANKLVSNILLHTTRPATRLITDFAADYMDDQIAQQHRDMMLVELDEHSLLRRKCAYKHEWTVRVIRDVVKDYNALQAREFRATDYQEFEQQYKNIVMRLRDCRQTMIDLEQAAKGLSTDVFELTHPSNEIATKLEFAFAYLGTDLSRLRKRLYPNVTQNNLLLERFNVNARRHNEAWQMLYCRDPEELQIEIAQIKTEYEEISYLLSQPA